jgi:hypothetical protein
LFHHHRLSTFTTQLFSQDSKRALLHYCH